MRETLFSISVLIIMMTTIIRVVSNTVSMTKGDRKQQKAQRCLFPQHTDCMWALSAVGCKINIVNFINFYFMNALSWILSRPAGLVERLKCVTPQRLFHTAAGFGAETATIQRRGAQFSFRLFSCCSGVSLWTEVLMKTTWKRVDADQQALDGLKWESRRKSKCERHINAAETLWSDKLSPPDWLISCRPSRKKSLFLCIDSLTLLIPMAYLPSVKPESSGRLNLSRLWVQAAGKGPEAAGWLKWFIEELSDDLRGLSLCGRWYSLMTGR